MITRRTLFASALAGIIAKVPGAVGAQEAIAEVIGGTGAIWRQKHVTVYVHTDERWHPYVAQSFADVKRLKIEKLPKFVVRYGEKRDCSSIDKNDYGDGAMVICSTPFIGGANGWTNTRPKHHGLTFVRIKFSDEELETQSSDFNQNTVCHELLHGLTWTDDAYGARPNNSCVHGYIPNPGSHDKKIIQRAYAAHRKAGGKKSGSKKRHSK